MERKLESEAGNTSSLMSHKSSLAIKGSTFLLFVFISGIAVFGFDEGLFDISGEIDSFCLDSKDNDIQSAQIFSSSLRYDNIYIKEFREAFYLDSDKLRNEDDLYALFKKKEYDKIISASASNYQQKIIKASALYNLGKYEDAINVLNSIGLDSDMGVDSIVKIIKAACYFNLEEHSKVLELLKNQNDDYSVLMKSMVSYLKNDDESALKLLTGIESARIEPQRSYMMLNIYYKKKDYSNTMTIIELFETQYPSFERMLNLKYIKGQILYNKGYFKRSIMALQDVVLGTDSNSVLLGNAYYLIGKNYFMLGEYDKMEEYLTFVKMDASKSDFKKNAEFLDGKGFFLKGDFKKAASKLSEFTERYPDDELTQYAFQLLAQSYFYQKNYKKSKLFMSKLKHPTFFAEKLVFMKYFIDYKDRLYSDSISAYLDFIAKETGNPMRRETYETIIKEAESESLRIWAFDNLDKEFPESENIPLYASNLCATIVKTCSAEQIQRIVMNIKKYRPEKFEALFIQYMRELFAKKEYQQIVELYLKYSSDLRESKSESSYITALSLKEMKNIDGALFMLDALSREENAFKDSSMIKRAMIYYEIYDIEYLKKFVSEEGSERTPFVEGSLYRIFGKKLFEQKRYSEAKTAYLRAVELFSDNRNMAAMALLDCSVSSMLLGEKKEAVIFAEKALLMATDIEVINKLKIQLDNLK